MKILTLSDQESKYLWDYYEPEKLADIDLVLSCGDLKARYLEFIATFCRAPVLYVHGNHDEHYLKTPPEGCTCIDGQLYNFNGLRILGLGGCMRYRPGAFQYTEKEMRRRVSRLYPKLWVNRGFDILLTHAPALGLNDSEHLAHRGFDVFNTLMDKYQPAYFVHGHVHMTYGWKFPRLAQHGSTCVVNAYERYIIELPDRQPPAGGA